MNRRSFLKSSAVLVGVGVSGVGLKELCRKRIVLDLREWNIDDTDDNYRDKWRKKLGAKEDCMIFAILSESCNNAHVRIIDFDGSVYYETDKKMVKNNQV